MPASTDELLSPALLAKLERLELVSRKIFRGRLKGERKSRRRGDSVEFADFRNYVAGDDLRLIDWNLYARLDQLFLKLFLEEEDLHVHVLVDASESMNFGTPTKLHLAKQLAAALGYTGLCHGDRVRVAALGPAARRAPVQRSRSGLAPMLAYLQTIDSGHNLSLEQGIRQFAVENSNSGVVILITDLLDKQGYEAALRILVGRRMDVVLVHLLATEELEPEVRGDFRFVDAEDQSTTEITLNDHALRRYQQTLQAFLDDAKHFCHRRGITYLLVRNDLPIEQVVSEYLMRRGVMR